MQALHYAESVQDIFEQPEQPPRDWTLYCQDVSNLYTTYDLGFEPPYDAVTLWDGHALAYYALSSAAKEIYVGTYWPRDKKWVRDHVIDLMLHRAQKVTRLDRLDESNVIDAARKWLEKV